MALVGPEIVVEGIRPPPPPPPPRAPSVESAAAGYTAQIEKGVQEDEGLKGSLQEITNNFAKQLNDLKAELPKPPDLKPFTPPKQENAAQMFGSLAGILALASGLLTNQPLTAGLNALAGAMKAKREGNKEAYDKSFEEWKTNTDYALKVADWQMQRYDEILKATNLGYDSQINLIKNLAAMTNDQVMLKQAELGGVVQVAQLNMDRAKTAMQLKAYQDQIDNVISPEDMIPVVDQFIRGDSSGLKLLGYGAKAQRNRDLFMKVLNERMDKLGIPQDQRGAYLAAATADFKGQVAESQTIGRRQGAIIVSATEAEQMAKLALDASDDLKRSGIKSVNDLHLAVSRETASPKLRQLDFYINSLVNAYARAINPMGVPTIEGQRHAREVLDAAFSRGDFRAAVEALQNELQVLRDAPAESRRRVWAGMSSQPYPGDSSGGGSTGGNSQFQKGEVYKDASGSKARFRGGDPTNPSNWEPVT